MNAQRWILLLLIILGMYASLATPWVVYPRIDVVLEGQMGDGWVFFALFLISLFIITLRHRKHILTRIQKWSLSAIMAIMLLLSVTKITDFNAEKAAFDSEDPYLITANAGSHVGWGLYMLITVLVLVLLMSLVYPKIVRS
jgi:hypothetical protein